VRSLPRHAAIIAPAADIASQRVCNRYTQLGIQLWMSQKSYGTFMPVQTG
jgi:hypothetical protein